MYSPLVTLSLFLEQVLGADHSCQDTVARGLISRIAWLCEVLVSGIARMKCRIDPVAWSRARSGV